MLKTDKFADMHIHCLADIDNGLAMLEEMRDFGIKDMNVCCLTYSDYSIDDNLRALYFKEKLKDSTSISVFGGLYYTPYINHYGIPLKEQAQRLLDMGCDGIKLIESKPEYRKEIGFGLDSKIYDELFDMLEEKLVPIVCHINDPEEYWDRDLMRKWPIGENLISRGWLYDDGTFLSYEEIFDETVKRLEKNPKLNIIFAHFMFLSKQIDVAEGLLKKFPNLKFDLTPGWEMFAGFKENYDAWRAFFEKYSDRIFYGTDTHSFPINRKIHETIRYCVGGEDSVIDIPHATFAQMRGFDLSKEAQENICYNNFKRTLPEIKAVNVPLLLEEIAKMTKLLKNNEIETEALARLERIYKELS